ncbi:MAG: hypothetical protein KJ638_05485 [Chloroflexi bacterium]|nr:hypothetical protein [Chloroflexota bacterium]
MRRNHIGLLHLTVLDAGSGDTIWLQTPALRTAVVGQRSAFTPLDPITGY